MTGMAYNFQKYNLDRIQYLGAPYDTGYYTIAFSLLHIYIYTIQFNLPAALRVFRIFLLL